MAETKDTFGLGFRPQHYGWVTTHCPPEVDVFEVVSENFMGVGGRPKFYLEKLRENYPILMHGVSLSIGSPGPFDQKYLRQLKELIHFIQPKMVSDHLSWGRFAHHNSHDLLPIAYTQESMNDLVGKIGYLQDYLGRRFFLENPSAYVAFASADYDEAGFFAELLQRTGAGILLDINNLYVNLRNLNQDPEHFLRALRPEDVGYFHLAGHSDDGQVLIDTHDQPVADTVWSLYGQARAYFPHTPAVVEWDGNVPDFPVLLAESEKARHFSLSGKLPVPKASPSEARAVGASASPNRSNLYNYSKFFEQIIKPFGIDDDGTANLKASGPTPADIGLRVYNHAYFLRLEELFVDIFPGLAFLAEEEGFRHLSAAYLQAFPPMETNLRMAAQSLPEYLRGPEAGTKVNFDFGVPLAILGDIAAIEWARSEAFVAFDHNPQLTPAAMQGFSPEVWENAIFLLSSSTQIVSCIYDILPVLHAFDNKEVPSPPELRSASYLVYRKGFAFQEFEIPAADLPMLMAVKNGTTLMEMCDVLEGSPQSYYTSRCLSATAGKLLEWANLGIIVLGQGKETVRRVRDESSPSE